MWTGGTLSSLSFRAKSLVASRSPATAGRRLGGISRYSEEAKIVRYVSTSLDMTKMVLALTVGFLATTFLQAQETSPSPSPSASPARSVRISFVPPPLEGKISLGVYNEWGQLVRALHQEAEFDEFTIGADALSTKWDGKDDYDYDLPAGKYSARGFLVAPMKIEQISQTDEAVFIDPAPPVRIKLVANPLEKMSGRQLIWSPAMTMTSHTFRL